MSDNYVTSSGILFIFHCVAHFGFQFFVQQG